MLAVSMVLDVQGCPGSAVRGGFLSTRFSGHLLPSTVYPLIYFKGWLGLKKWLLGSRHLLLGTMARVFYPQDPHDRREQTSISCPLTP